MSQSPLPSICGVLLARVGTDHGPLWIKWLDGVITTASPEEISLWRAIEAARPYLSHRIGCGLLNASEEGCTCGLEAVLEDLNG